MQSNCKFLRDEPKARSLNNRLLNCKKNIEPRSLQVVYVM